MSAVNPPRTLQQKRKENMSVQPLRFGIVQKFNPFYHTNPKVVTAKGVFSDTKIPVSFIAFPDPKYPSVLNVQARAMVSSKNQIVDRWEAFVATSQSTLQDRFATGTLLKPVQVSLLQKVAQMWRYSNMEDDEAFTHIPLDTNLFTHQAAEARKDAVAIRDQWESQQQTPPPDTKAMPPAEVEQLLRWYCDDTGKEINKPYLK